MLWHPRLSLFSRLTAAILALAAFHSSAAIDARLLRYPDVSGTQITFVYAGDIWVVPKTGGTANRLSSPRGEESVPRFSPDGSRVAFTASYDGNTEAYVVPTTGGPVERLTLHPAPDVVSDWFPDGSAVLVASRMESETGKYSQFFRVPLTGGIPVRLPVPFGEIGAVSPDGSWLAYTPRTVHSRTWKRHRGGTAPDIWLFNLQTWESRNLTDHAAADEFPMWHGRKLYFLSDRGPNQRQNLWVHDLDNGSFRQVTQFDEYDVHTPAIGPEEIVFEAGGRIHLLNLADETHRPVRIEVITDLATLRPRNENVASLVRTVTPSPSGRRVVIESRGELFSAPARHGAIVNLTRSPGVAERFPSWSPDGKHLAYVTDRPGEYQLALRPADGGEETILTTFADGYRYQPFWSPDSRKLAFVDHAFELQVYDLDRKQTTIVDSLRWVFHQDLLGFRVSWSSDSRWLAYSRALDHSQTAIILHDLQTLERHQVTSGFYQDSQPTFDPEGKYLFYLTSRQLNPIYDDLQNTWIYPNTVRIAAVPLRRDVPSPLKTRNDAEGDDAEEKQAKKDSDGKSEAAKKPATEVAIKADPSPVPSDKTTDAKPATAETASKTSEHDKPAPVEIHLAEFERRSVLLPPRAGQYDSLTATKGRILYLRRPNKGSPEESSALMFYDLKEREEKTVLAEASAFTLTADGKKILVQRKRDWTFVNVAPDQKFENPIATSDLETTVDPVEEWRQIFADAWRFNRDYFYDPSMHGLDWKRVRDQYAALLPHAVTRWDVNFLIGELIGELNASHTYRNGGDLESAPQRPVGLLGVDWSLEQGAFRVSRILRGAPWDTEVRSPLDEPGLQVAEGTFVLAVNGRTLDPARTPWEPFAGLAGKTVRLTLNDKPSLDGSRQVVVQTLTGSEEQRLRHLAWVESNRQRVAEATDGKVGYIYVPDTTTYGQTELFRQFRAQFHRAGLVIDERFNSGGQLGDRFLELLGRKTFTHLAFRHGLDQPWPPVGHTGPQVMLINEWSGSGGDAFPWFFKTAGRGPIIGRRTWGGLIGPAIAHEFIDGGSLVVPPCRLYGPDGKWFAEGHGVEPDIDVPENPTSLARGIDVQLERAITEALRLLRENPVTPTPRPAFEYRGWPK